MTNGAFFICRAVTAAEWLALKPSQRMSTLDMTDALVRRPVGEQEHPEENETHG